jgi:hypothetical protein
MKLENFSNADLLKIQQKVENVIIKVVNIKVLQYYKYKEEKTNLLSN